MNKLYDNIYVAGQINETDFPGLADAGIKTIINNRPDAEEPGQLSHTRAAELAAQHGIAYHFLPMANGQPIAADLVAEFKQIVDNTEQPVLAHCRSGMRSSVLWALGKISAGEISVDEAIVAGQGAGIPLQNARPLLDSVTLD